MFKDVEGVKMVVRKKDVLITPEDRVYSDSDMRA